MSRQFQVGDPVMVVDRRDREYLIILEPAGEFHTHAGFVRHDDIIGQQDGLVVESTGGTKFLVIKPTLSEQIMHMPRGAQVIYPKDLGQILMLADIYPGVRVLEAGVGSGALSMTLLRAGANVVGYEIREDFATRAKRNIAEVAGQEAANQYKVELRDIYDGIDETDLDRIILDLPEPWRVVKHATSALARGGIILAYLPSITQVITFREELSQNRFGMEETTETLVRSWKIDGQIARPDHRMVAHTAFLTVARYLGRDS